jgi:hypothetical protein
MPTENVTVTDPHAPVVFRRTITLIWAGVLTSVFVLIGVLLGIAFAHDGFFSIIAPIAALAPLITFALMALAWPSVVIRDDTMLVRNAYATYVIPYQLIKEVVMFRIGMFIRVHDRPKIPVTAYASSGTAGRAFGHKKSAARLSNLIEDKISWATSQVDGAVVTRTVDVRNVIITVAAFVIPTIVVVLAVATYPR